MASLGNNLDLVLIHLHPQLEFVQAQRCLEPFEEVTLRFHPHHPIVIFALVFLIEGFLDVLHLEAHFV